MHLAILLSSMLTVNQIVAQHPVTGNPPSDFAWAPNGSAYVYSIAAPREGQPPVLWLHDMRTGRDRELFKAKSTQRGSRSRPVSEVVWSHDSRRIALINAGALEIVDPSAGTERRLTQDADDPQWSPDDREIAYVHANDLYMVRAATGSVTRLTTTGSQTRINGDPDWLYSEEMNVEHAFAWSPHGRRIAYLSFDERPITPFPIENYLPRINNVEEQRYPLAGGKNPRVSLNVVDVVSRSSRRLYDGAPKDEYVLSFTWSPKGVLLDQIMDRAQKHLRWVAFGPHGGSHDVTSESNPEFVDVEPIPKWSADGGAFYLLSQRGGRHQLWNVNVRTGAARRISGDYTIRDVLRVDNAKHVAYAQAYYPTRRDRCLLQISLRNGHAVNLTPSSGVHDVVLASNAPNFIEISSSYNSPPVVERGAIGFAERKMIFRTPDLSRFRLGTVRAVDVPSQWGPLSATLVVPKDFDPGHRYPVVFMPYGGPLGVDDNSTMDRWPGLFPFLLAQHGILVFTIDGPATQVGSAANERMFYHRMGLIAMAGQLAGVNWINKQSFAEPGHLGLMGWSYGGYLTAFTMTHAPGVFRSGIAGAPPADWRYYDTAYTERYMSEPAQAKGAYQATSVLPAAGKLRGKLLILQGTADDNVHLMNSIALLQAFIKNGKHVDYFVYPGARHGPTQIAQRRDVDTRMLLWWIRTLQ